MIRIKADFIRKVAIQRKIAQATDRDLALIAAELETETKQRTPVLTGRLRASFKAKKNKFLDYEVGTNVVYAPFVEFGTSRRAPVAMLRTAASVVLRKSDNIITNVKKV